jgi:hypothetical protein
MSADRAREGCRSTNRTCARGPAPPYLSCLRLCALHQEAAEYFAATPAALFLANPLGKSFEPKPRKEIVRSKRRENVSDDVCPRLHPLPLLELF